MHNVGTCKTASPDNNSRKSEKMKAKTSTATYNFDTFIRLEITSKLGTLKATDLRLY